MKIFEITQFLDEGFTQWIDSKLAADASDKLSQKLLKGISNDSSHMSEIKQLRDAVTRTDTPEEKAKIVKAVADILVKFDPTAYRNGNFNPEQNNSKLFDFLATRYAAGQFILEDNEQWFSILSDYINYSKNKHFERFAKFAENNPDRVSYDFDLNRYKAIQNLSMSELHDFISASREVEYVIDEVGKDVVSSDQHWATIKEQGKVLLDTPKLTIISPQTNTQLQKTAMEFARIRDDRSYDVEQTRKIIKWCTLGKELFNQYSGDGPLYTLLVNKTDPSSMRAFHYHFHSKQFKNEEDRKITEDEIALLSAIPAYTKFLSWQCEVEYKELFDSIKEAE